MPTQVDQPADAEQLRDAAPSTVASSLDGDGSDQGLRPPSPGLEWVVLVVGLMLQWGLFSQFVRREVAWAYPPSDQASALRYAYETYEAILSEGVLGGLRVGLAEPVASGVMLPIQAGMLFFLTGPSRLTALSLNFLYFALLQAVVVWTSRWLTGRTDLALCGLGLVLLIKAPLRWVGGIADFRMESIAFSLYGIFIAIVLRSGVFRSWRWSLVAGLIAALCVLFRFITLVYFVGILGVFLAYLARAPKATGTGGPNRRQAIPGLVVAGIAMSALAVPTLLLRRSAIMAYYVVGHVTGPEKWLRAREIGNDTLVDHLSFYPRSVSLDHAGWAFLAASTALLLLIGLPFGRGAGRRARGRLAARLPVRDASVFIAICFAVPLVVLTLDLAKSGAVGAVLVPPLLWGVLLVLAWQGPPPGSGSWLCVTLATGVLVCGVVHQSSYFTSRGPLSRSRPEVEEVSRLHDTIGAFSHQLGWREASMFHDRIRDYLGAAEASLYERHGQRLRLHPALWTLFEVPEEQAMARLADSQFVVLAREGTATRSPYPYDRQMQFLGPRLTAFCREHLVWMGRFLVPGEEIDLYVRPAVRMAGDSGGWVTDSGLILHSFAPVFRRYPRLELRGQIDLSLLQGRPPSVAGEVRQDRQRPFSVPAALHMEGESYRIHVSLPGERFRDGPVAVHLLFDAYFVPKDIGLNDDTRRLVVRVPTDVRFLAGEPSRPAARSEGAPAE